MKAAPRLSVALAFAAVCLAAVGPACISRSHPEKLRHVLVVERPESVPPRGEHVLRIESLRVSELFERKGFVYRTGDTTYEEDFYNEFYLQPGSLLRRVTQDWLEDSGMFSGVLGGADRGRADWSLEGWVSSLHADLRRGDTVAVIEIEFTVVDVQAPRSELAFQRRYVSRRSAGDRSAAAILRAWMAGTAEILTDLEADLTQQLPLAVPPSSRSTGP